MLGPRSGSSRPARWVVRVEPDGVEFLAVGLARAIHQRPADLAEAAMVLVDRDLALLLDGAAEELAGDGDRAVDDRLRGTPS